MWRLAWIWLLVLPACYEAVPRRGPLAHLADSLFPADARVRCESVSIRLPRQPRHKLCIPEGDTSAFYTVGVAGRILSVVQNLPPDSISARHIEGKRQLLTKQLGKPAYEGDDTHGNIVHSWHSDSLCASLYEIARPRGVQLSYNTPEFFGGCVS